MLHSAAAVLRLLAWGHLATVEGRIFDAVPVVNLLLQLRQFPTRRHATRPPAQDVAPPSARPGFLYSESMVATVPVSMTLQDRVPETPAPANCSAAPGSRTAPRKALWASPPRPMKRSHQHPVGPWLRSAGGGGAAAEPFAHRTGRPTARPASCPGWAPCAPEPSRPAAELRQERAKTLAPPSAALDAATVAEGCISVMVLTTAVCCAVRAVRNALYEEDAATGSTVPACSPRLRSVTGTPSASPAMSPSSSPSSGEVRRRVHMQWLDRGGADPSSLTSSRSGSTDDGWELVSAPYPN
eukprot:TRINITY_DN19458_c0_g1_i1.p1 TRINITY_DN19458_c0_g1~~TRINITY_DN19458_c0_g1_i1.p1  ORF type:complete len:298 (+),score=47.23 TRINITY_DN19458_c0_g1_i1:95-988(+)